MIRIVTSKRWRSLLNENASLFNDNIVLRAHVERLQAAIAAMKILAFKKTTSPPVHQTFDKISILSNFVPDPDTSLIKMENKICPNCKIFVIESPEYGMIHKCGPKPESVI